jgi:MFS transporter, CP family, cyanate transporter
MRFCELNICTFNTSSDLNDMATEKRQKIILLLAVILISINLRPAITAVGPLVPEIRLDTGMPNYAIGLLTTLPVLSFGIFSVFTPLLTRKIGTEGTMAFALILISGGIFLRVHPAILTLFGGTILLGIGIALGNVLLPGIIKKQFPSNVGLLTGLYSAMFGVGAAIASGISVPLSEDLGLGWRWSLGTWGFLALIAVICWLPQMRTNLPVTMRKGFRESLRQLGSSKLAWYVSLFMGVQSLSFYTLIAWLPEILTERGLTASEAGWQLALMQGVGILSTLLFPAWASRLKHQQLPVLVLVLFEIIALIGLSFPTLTLVGLWVSLMGFALGGSFGLALLLIVLRSRDSTSANELSGMSQSVGYTLAATGPVLFGAFFDLFNSWLLPLGFLFVIALLKLWSGFEAGKDQFVD